MRPGASAPAFRACGGAGPPGRVPRDGPGRGPGRIPWPVPPASSRFRRGARRRHGDLPRDPRRRARVQPLGLEVVCSRPPMKVTVGQEFSATATVKNTGDTALANVTLQLRGRPGRAVRVRGSAGAPAPDREARGRRLEAGLGPLPAGVDGHRPHPRQRARQPRLGGGELRVHRAGPRAAGAPFRHDRQGPLRRRRASSRWASRSSTCSTSATRCVCPGLQ